MLNNRRFTFSEVHFTRHILPGGNRALFNSPGQSISRAMDAFTRSIPLANDSVSSDASYPEHTLNSPDPLLHGVKKATPTMLLTKSLKLSLIFNARRAWWDTRKSSQVSWRIPRTENHKLRWQNRRLNALLTVVTLRCKSHDCFATLWAAIMTMGLASPTRTLSLIHIKTRR